MICNLKGDAGFKRQSDSNPILTTQIIKRHPEFNIQSPTIGICLLNMY